MFHIDELLAKKKTPIAAIKGNRFLNCFIPDVDVFGCKRRRLFDFSPIFANYDLKEHQLIHIFETFYNGFDYDSYLQEVLKQFHKLIRNI